MASASETPMDETESEEEEEEAEAEPSVDSSEGRYPITCLEQYKPLEIPSGAAANRKQLQ